MNYVYVDPTVAVSGNGSESSPYKSVSAYIAAGVVHPFKLMIKAGTTLVDTANFGTKLKNESGESSIITRYGSGRNPRWINSENRSSSISGSHIRGDQVRSLLITGLDFHCKNNLEAIGAAQTIITLNLPNSYSTDIDAEVWVSNCNFYGEPRSTTGRYAYYNSAINLYVMSGATKRVNRFGVTDCNFHYVARPIQLIGNHAYAADVTDNRTGTMYSRGVKVINCGMVGCAKGGVEFGGCESELSAYTEDKYQTVCRNCTYSSYNWDQGDANGGIFADACFWTYRCNRVMFEYIKCSGATPMVADNEVIDFDMMSWDCVARFIVGSNCGCSLLVISSDSGARARYSDYSSLYTQDEWYYTRRNGSGNNVFEHCVMFNCGINRGWPGGYDDAVEIRTKGFVYNTMVRNVLFIDTVSVYPKPILGNGVAARSNGIPGVVLSNCTALYRYCKGTEMIVKREAATLPDMTEVSNCCFWSLAWRTADAAAAVASLDSTSTGINRKVQDPQMVFIPGQAPVTLEAAKLLRTLSTSPCISGGAASATTDINGKSGSSIWWMQL